MYYFDIHIEGLTREQAETLYQAWNMTSNPDMGIEVTARIGGAEDEIKPSEANPMDLSADTIQYCHLYMQVVEQQEQGQYDQGLTPKELDLKRVRIHDLLIQCLKRDHVDVSIRTDTTTLARRICEWIPE